ncbi:class I SAM-dependent methyltransferase [Methanocella arvoryzae]|uniref:Methyltransferase type 11 domain-containing protein n=1 Tax=Methanocella arvoryzae (strain DSM 22066 / NBRC 105507 / MRE50) TaxID=351160 RepID=Q0W229_METAR|nr:class I SAM-dependent methyltransferase [Methanocella arvoryzae]CAJ37564.1 conserved hypothetical protein [Methanocella arvoryzae MRE50]
MTIADPDHTLPGELWTAAGFDEHPGGGKATERLQKMAGVAPGQRVLDMGCGAGRTADMLAKSGVSPIVVDLDAGVLIKARALATRSGTSEKLSFIQADLHHLPFKEGTFDAALAESVLAYCDAAHVVRESYRVLKPGGAFGFNELTYLHAPDPALKAVLRHTLKASPHLEREWKLIFRSAGFAEVVSTISKISLRAQFLSRLKTGGMLAGAGRLAGCLARPEIARSLLNPGIRGIVMKFRSSVGYGLYAGRKP